MSDDVEKDIAEFQQVKKNLDSFKRSDEWIKRDLLNQAKEGGLGEGDAEVWRDLKFNRMKELEQQQDIEKQVVNKPYEEEREDVPVEFEQDEDVEEVPEGRDPEIPVTPGIGGGPPPGFIDFDDLDDERARIQGGVNQVLASAGGAPQKIEVKVGSENEATPEEEYESFLRATRWNEQKLALVSEKNIPMYWKEMTPEQKKLNNIAREINNVAFHKRTAVFDFKTYAESEDLAGIQKEELRMVYDKAPGARQAYELYRKLFREPETFQIEREEYKNGRMERKQVPIFEASDIDEAEQFRDFVAASIADEVRTAVEAEIRRSGKTLTPVEIDQRVALRVTETEQVVFNSLFALNAFEAWSKEWVEVGAGDDKKDRRESGGNWYCEQFVNVPLVFSMYPVDILLTKAHKDPPDYHGAFGEWFATQLKSHRVEGDSYDVVETVPAKNKREMSKYWTITNDGGKRVLHIPACYPAQTIGSVWDDTKVRDKSLTEYLDAGERIPWEDPKLSDISGNYSRRCAKAHIILEHRMGLRKLGINERKSKDDFEPDKLQGAYALVRELDSVESRRWDMYAANGIIVDRAMPKLQGNRTMKNTTKKIFEMWRHVPNNESVFHPEDGIGSIFS